MRSQIKGIYISVRRVAFISIGILFVQVFGYDATAQRVEIYYDGTYESIIPLPLYCYCFPDRERLSVTDKNFISLVDSTISESYSFDNGVLSNYDWSGTVFVINFRDECDYDILCFWLDSYDENKKFSPVNINGEIKMFPRRFINAIGSLVYYHFELFPDRDANNPKTIQNILNGKRFIKSRI